MNSIFEIIAVCIIAISFSIYALVLLKKAKDLKSYEKSLMRYEDELNRFNEALRNKHFEQKTSQFIIKIVKDYENISSPPNIVKNMSYDDFVDWLELGSKEDIEAAIEVFKTYKMDSHVKIMEIYLSKLK